MQEPGSSRPIIGLLLVDLSDSRFVDVWRGVCDELHRHGADVRCFCAGALQNERFSKANPQGILCRSIDAHTLDGLITFDWWRDEAWFEHICRPYLSLPIVTVMRHFENYPGIRVDNKEGSRQQLRHLLDIHDRRRIAYCIGTGTPSAQERYQGYINALRENRISVDSTLVVPCLDDELPDTRDIRQHGRHAASILLDERGLQPGRDFDAIVTFNDTMAYGVLDELRDRSIQVPDDIAVAGFDNHEEAANPYVPVTTVAIPWYELGQRAAAMLWRWLSTGARPAHERVSPSLIIRRSCGCQEPAIRYLRHESAYSPKSKLPECQETTGELQTALANALIPHVKTVIPAADRWCAQLVEAFLDECSAVPRQHGKNTSFLHIFEQGLLRIEQAGGAIEAGQNLISDLFRRVQSTQGARLCHEARILIQTFTQRAQQREYADAVRRAAILREIGQRLITTFDVAGLMDILAEDLPRLGIRSCYLVQYPYPQAPQGQARMLLAYNEQGRVLFTDTPYIFPASHIVPADLVPRQSPRKWVVEALVFDSSQLGFVVFDDGPEETSLYAILRSEISSALQGALLVREIKARDEHLEELVEQRTSQLRHINVQLHEAIEQQTQTEHALRSSEQQYRLLADNVDYGIVIIQGQSIVFSNTVLANMLGVPARSLLKADPATLLNIEFPNAFPDGEERDQRQQREDALWQTQLLGADGRELWVEIGQTSIVWNGQPAALLTVRDVTHRMLKELRLEEERSRLHQENITLRSNIKERFRFGPLVGKSLVMQQVYEAIMNAAGSDVNVLIIGESGTGKELIARTLHKASVRCDRALVTVNCASIPETLFEREFFGHRRGTFTGAERDRPGFFDRAHQGVLFLDEVTELTPGTQAKLLRVLQDGEYTPLGSTMPKQADVLIVAATNKDPHTEIAHSRLRQDFFYRIGVIEVNVPPLRDRKDDLPLLIEHILEGIRQKRGSMSGDLPAEMPVDISCLPAELAHAMYAYHWPGNVRELQNILQRYLANRNLEAVLQRLGKTLPAHPVRSVYAPPQGLQLPEAIRAVEKQMIEDTLRRTRHNVVKTAKLLGISRGSLYRKMKQCGLDGEG